MRIQCLVLTVLLTLVSSIAFAGDAKNGEEIGLDQKLQRLYELYRVGDTVSLKPHEFRLGIGLSYSGDSSEQLGVRLSSQTLATQVSLAYGITPWLEAAVSVPFQMGEQHLESTDKKLLDRRIVGVGGIGLRLISTIPTKTFETTAIFGVNFPTGDDRLGGNITQTTVGLNVAKILQPAFIFGGLSWERDWKNNTNGIGYNAGIGFYLNHYLSAGLEFSGVRILNPPKGGVYDTLSATVRLSYQATPSFGITPYLSHGLTPNAPDFVVGTSLQWRF